jgi:hypothetical protein
LGWREIYAHARSLSLMRLSKNVAYSAMANPAGASS